MLCLPKMTKPWLVAAVFVGCDAHGSGAWTDCGVGADNRPGPGCDRDEMNTFIKSGIVGFVLLPVAFIVMGVYSVLFPTYSATLFLVVEVWLVVYSLYRLMRGMQGIRGIPQPTERSRRDVGFGVGALLAFLLGSIKIYFFPTVHLF